MKRNRSNSGEFSGASFAEMRKAYAPTLQEIAEAKKKISLICNDELRDPLSLSFAFMPRPWLLRNTCKTMLERFDHCIYLETPLPWPYITRGSRNDILSVKAMPVSFSKFPKIRTFSTLHLEGIPDLDLDFCQLLEAVSVVSELCLSHLPGLATVEANFFYESRTLRKATLRSLPKLTAIHRGFMGRTSNLVDVELVSLPLLKDIGARFLSDNMVLETFSIRDLPSLSTIDKDCLSYCALLTQITFEHLPQLSSVGDHWLWSCEKLETVQLHNLPKLSTIGNSFLSSCPSLVEAVFENMPALTQVGDFWLSNCKSLEKIRFCQVPSLHSIGESFASNDRNIVLRDSSALSRSSGRGKNTTLVDIGDNCANVCITDALLSTRTPGFGEGFFDAGVVSE